MRPNEKTFSIYVHTAPNGKKYVGKTCLHPVNRRWHGGNAYRQQPLFYNAIKKYGWDSFTHEIVLSGLTESEANTAEKRLILELKTNDRRFGYNCTDGGEGANGYTLSPEQVKQRRARMIGEGNPMFGRKHTDAEKLHIGNKSRECWASNPGRHKEHSEKMSGANNPNAKDIDIYTQDGAFVCTVHCKKEAAEFAGVSTATVKGCINRKTKPVGKYVFRCHGDPYVPDKDRYRDCRNKPIWQLSMNGDRIRRYDSATDAAQVMNTKPNNIAAAARGAQKSSCGFLWRYEE